MPKKRKDAQETGLLNRPVIIEETTSANDFRPNLEEIKSIDGVVGYIFRNTKSAAIDLKEPEKIIDYAILSSSSIDASKKLSELFDMGEVESIVVKGKNIKMLSLPIGESNISIFMEKDASIEEVMRKLHAI
jgi:predicted regulator of Ras-like GTPase activity (Roadblock/LC7/MglB family)